MRDSAIFTNEVHECVCKHEGALDFIRQEKQLLDQWYPEPEQKMAENYLTCVLIEATCLWHP